MLWLNLAETVAFIISGRPIACFDSCLLFGIQYSSGRIVRRPNQLAVKLSVIPTNLVGHLSWELAYFLTNVLHLQLLEHRTTD